MKSFLIQKGFLAHKTCVTGKQKRRQHLQSKMSRPYANSTIDVSNIVEKELMIGLDEAYKGDGKTKRTHILCLQLMLKRL